MGFVLALNTATALNSVARQRVYTAYKGISLTEVSSTSLVFTMNAIDAGDTDGRVNKGTGGLIGLLT